MFGSSVELLICFNYTVCSIVHTYHKNKKIVNIINLSMQQKCKDLTEFNILIWLFSDKVVYQEAYVGVIV